MSQLGKGNVEIRVKKIHFNGKGRVDLAISVLEGLRVLGEELISQANTA